MTRSAHDTLAEAAEALARAGVDSPRHDAEVLLAWVLGIPRAALATVPDLAMPQWSAFTSALRRRAAREPLQHITGSGAFRYLDLVVGPGVFVPRPETEVMAGIAVAELERLVRSGVGRPRAVDLCAGSGAVAVALASEVPAASVTAVELSPQAHEYAVRNGGPLGVDVRLGDIADTADDLSGLAHVVTANPPYIPMTEFETVAPEARDFDPPLALWSGHDGLDTIRVVESVAARLLVGDGLVLCEHADSQGDVVPALFAETGRWCHVRDNVDLAGRPRFVSARRAPRSDTPAGTMGV